MQHKQRLQGRCLGLKKEYYYDNIGLLLSTMTTSVYAPQSGDASELQGIQHAHCGGNYSQEERRLDSCF